MQPTVRDLRSAAADLAVVTPRLTKTVRVVNSLLNTLAFNPAGAEEGYLFWASWANHAGVDAVRHPGRPRPDPPRARAGRRAAGSAILDQIASTTPSLNVLIQLLNAPRQSEVCPQAVP